MVIPSSRPSESYAWFHKVHIYLEYHNVCPLVRIWTPSPAGECVAPPVPHSVCHLVRIGTPSPAGECVAPLYHTVSVPSSELGPPLTQASVSPPEPRGGHTRLRVRGVGDPNSDDWRKNL